MFCEDARIKAEYDESHIITAKRVHREEDGEYLVPYDAELECKVHVIVYDGNTRSLREKSKQHLSCHLLKLAVQ